jgi:hypothetical protein
MYLESGTSMFFILRIFSLWIYGVGKCFLSILMKWLALNIWIPNVTTVKRLYCKRPIQCLASSKILTPPPLPGDCVVYPPAFGAGGGHTRWVERGWGVNILEDARHSSVLYVCKYFVVTTNYHYTVSGSADSETVRTRKPRLESKSFIGFFNLDPTTLRYQEFFLLAPSYRCFSRQGNP